jgi:hypothetical protein
MNALREHGRRFPPPHPCGHHTSRDLPLFQQIGIVDRVDERYGEHRYVVVFPTLTVPPFGSAWVDSFTADELVPVDEPE